MMLDESQLRSPSTDETRKAPSPSGVAWAAFLAISVAVGVLWCRFHPAPPRRGLQNPGDLLNFFHPVTEYVGLRLASGDLPLWDPHVCAGLPLFASLQAGILYPGTWLATVLPAHQALAVLMFVECVLGACFTAMLLRTWRMTPLAASLGGVLFAFSCLVGQTFWPNEVATIVWLPWLLLCVERLYVRWQWRWWIGLGVGTALQQLAGFPQFALYTFYFLFVLIGLRALWALIRRDETTRRDLLATVAIVVALVIGIGIASVQLVPTAELLTLSHRAESITSAEAHYLGHRTARSLLVQLVNPAAKMPTFDFSFSAGYLGISTVLFFAVGLVAGWRSPRMWFLMVGGLVALALSNGYAPPTRAVYEMFAMLPTGDLFRSPERIRLLYFVCFIAIAMGGLDAAVRGLTEHLGRTRGQVAYAVAGLTTIGLVLFGQPGTTWRALAGFGLLVALSWSRSNRRAHALAQVCLFSLVVADLALALGPYGPMRSFPTDLTRTFHWSGHTMVSGEEFAEFRERGGLDRSELVANPDGYLAVLPLVGSEPIGGGYRLSCYQALVPGQLAALHKATGRVTTMNYYLAHLDPDEHPAIYDAASVRFIMRFAFVDVEAAHRKMLEWHSVHPAGEAYELSPQLIDGVERTVLTNSDALPRAYTLEHYRVVEEESALQALANDTFDPHRTVLVDRAPQYVSPTGTLAKVRPAVISSYEPERVEMQTSGPRDAILVLTDTAYPGWSVTVDGKEGEILRANGLFRGVHVGPGEHRVVFEFRPRSFHVGLAMSAASLLVLGCIPLVAIRRRRRTSVDSP